MTIARLSDMAAKKFMKGSEEWQMFQDLWKLAQEIWEPEDTDEYWNEVIEKTRQFHGKYRTPYSLELACGLENAVNRACKEKAGGGS